MHETTNSARPLPPNRFRRVIDLRLLTSLDTDKQIALREIRNEPSVRAAMLTQHVVGLNEHLQWLRQLKESKKQLVFAMLDDGENPVGAASLDQIDLFHKKADWGFYVGEKMRGIGLGSAVAFHLIEFSFGILELEKINAEVIEGNQSSLKYHAKFGFSEEGFRKSNLVAQGKRVGMHMLGLERDVWLRRRADVVSLCGGALSRIDLKIHWTPSQETKPTPIDQIEAARARNNLNWMSILRIALERSPSASKQIVAEIKNLDQEISALTQKLLE